MEVRRGRPTGYKLSKKSKEKISKSKIGQTHTGDTKDKIRNSVIEYYKTDKGMAQKQLFGEISSEFWNSYSGKLARQIMKHGMKKYWEKHKQEMEKGIEG